MESVYWFIFGLLAVIVAGMLLTQGGIVSGNASQLQAFFSLRNNYVFVYALMMAGDWLQGPYVYALYQHYGYGVKDIGRLFIAGFGSSMLFGTVVGSLADKHGRKKAALLYVLTYAASCATKHSPDYGILMFGRLLGGIATSLLFSAFESWLVAEHFSRGFDEKWLGDTFSKAVFVGNGLMAILAGLVASYLVDTLKLGPVAPFDAAIVVLVAGGAVIYASWPENYGDSARSHPRPPSTRPAFDAPRADQRIALLGAMQSLFEASMYTFVFLWTPALSPAGEKIYHGMIFACFMTASMAGSSLSAILMKRYKVEAYMKYVFGLSAVALSVPFLFHVSLSKEGKEAVRGISLQGQIQLVAFCVFEVLVGIFWPSMMTLRARFIPDETRSTIINMFRIPLNLFVCIILYNVHLFPLSAMFALCSVFLAIAAVLQVSSECVN
ncbi:hypothetical protein VOLCADRAFT_58801 [Volvox carteri f. nagariensis]|uniref:Molybdate-anion transporter n=1 Tax=Volvox carteri f. nagariensis TaxID=3068 RepID=D8TRF3_VOLCA|nr:uncharacterized protein VOLCADRAFT_58801 [Volvox carteri f. nagariensis]EFJ49984.1 hypothetical protein VOLCADRAFT_58801 [Volvox carteri f. nagariensis]|eukprot:XP_002949049.1 hypothetical protein VOLCADRAFT_58801 [Volvox carteri f. nagariensis]